MTKTNKPIKQKQKQIKKNTLKIDQNYFVTEILLNFRISIDEIIC